MSAAVEQPAPVPNDGASSHDLAVADVAAWWHASPAISVVRAGLAERKQLGLERYGTVLQAGNGRDALVDAFQESLDLVVYLRTALTEAGWPGRSTGGLLEAYMAALRNAIQVGELVLNARGEL